MTESPCVYVKGNKKQTLVGCGTTTKDADKTVDEATAYGYDAGHKDAGNFNTFIGHSSGQKTTGESNTFLGQNAGGNASGSDNIFIGQGVGATASGNNQFVIGNQTNSKWILGEIGTDTLEIQNQQVSVDGHTHSGLTPHNHSIPDHTVPDHKHSTSVLAHSHTVPDLTHDATVSFSAYPAPSCSCPVSVTSTTVPGTYTNLV